MNSEPGHSPNVGVGGLLTHEQRIANYCRETGHPRSLFVGEDGRIVGTWIMGNDYRVKSTYYGGYPAGYLKRVRALFPDKLNVLHLFSGRVDVGTLPGKTVDINAENAPDYVDDAQTLERVPLCDFDLVCADPPYSVEDCDHYKTTMIKRNVVMRTLGARLRPGTHVVWLDQVLPMWKKSEFSLVGCIGVCKSTNHRFRMVSIFIKLPTCQDIQSTSRDNSSGESSSSKEAEQKAAPQHGGVGANAELSLWHLEEISEREIPKAAGVFDEKQPHGAL